MIRKSALLTEQFQKLVIKNKFGYDIYDNIESFFLEKYNEKVFKTSVYCMNNLEPKTVVKRGYMAYHDPDLFFVVYLAYVNMSTLDQKYFELIPELIDQGILKNIFLTSIYQVPKNFPEKLKTIVDIFFKPKIL